jgi:hypothetical protein
MEDFTRLFRERLFAAFYNWLDVNKEIIGEHWYTDLHNKTADYEATCNTIMKIMGGAMWMFNMIADRGVLAGLGPNHFDLQALAPGLDETSSKRILALIAASLGLQGLPLEIVNKEVPIISSKKFSLELFTKTR